MPLTGEIQDYPTRILVNSEEHPEEEAYLVDLCGYKVGNVFNGVCQCKDFVFRCEPRLKRPGNTIICRCKHIRYAREIVLDYVLPAMRKHDPNIDEDGQI